MTEHEVMDWDELGRGARELLAAAGLGERRGDNGAIGIREDRRLDLRRDLGQVGECLGGIHGRAKLPQA